MISCNPSYSAKILLFGEYSILLGSSALSIPYNHFNAEFCFIQDDKNIDLKQAEESQQHLLELLNYLEEFENYIQILDLNRFRLDISNGLYLKSTIPNSYGLGSSGTVVAAVYSRYSFKNISNKNLSEYEMEKLFKLFSHMESFFHGTSSGIDPLSIYISKPLFISNERKPSIVEIPRNSVSENVSGFLLDTGESCKSNPLVTVFLDQFATDGKLNEAAKLFVSLTDQCINSLLSGNINDFRNSLLALSAFQLSNMHTLIPDKMIKVWKDGLESNSLIMKLCGSGGGGYLTAFTFDHNTAVQFLEKNKLLYMPIFFANS
jgi:mevalonate kinase